MKKPKEKKCNCLCHNPKYGSYHGIGVYPCCGREDIKHKFPPKQDREKTDGLVEEVSASLTNELFDLFYKKASIWKVRQTIRKSLLSAKKEWKEELIKKLPKKIKASELDRGTVFAQGENFGWNLAIDEVIEVIKKI